MDLPDRQAMNKGFGDALARAFELAATPAVFGFLGWLVDDRVGTTPLFTVVLTLLVFGYVAWKMWSGYETTMQGHERRLGVDRRAGAGGDEGHG